MSEFESQREELEQLSEAVRHEQEERLEVEIAGVDLPALHERLEALVRRIERRECVAVFVFDASRLGAWERQYGAGAFDAIIRRLSAELMEVGSAQLGEQTLVCLEARGGDTVLVFPARTKGQGAREATLVDLEDQLHQLNKALLRRFGSCQLWFHEALEAVTSGSSVILHHGAVDPRRAIYRAVRKARHDARIAHGEIQRRRNRIVGHVIAHRKIRTLYQPIVRLEQGQPAFGFEALSRPLAREARKLGVHLFVAASRAELDGELDATCRALSLARRPRLEGDQRLFVNCLPQTFYDEMGELERALEQWSTAELEPEQLVFELTESITRKQATRIMSNIRGLRRRGYQFALDDVGTGAANLQLLAELEPDFIKMDMSLTIGIASSARKRRLAMYLLELARSSDAELIAEGIEDPADLEVIEALGVELGQGFLLGEPTHAPEAGAAS